MMLPYSPADYATAAAWALTLGALLYRLAPGPHRPALLAAWTLKTLVTMAAIPFYERRYFGFDEDHYFFRIAEPDFAWRGLRLGSGTENMSQLTWLHLEAVFDSQMAVKVGFSMIGLLAVYVFYRAAVLLPEKEDLRLLPS